MSSDQSMNDVLKKFTEEYKLTIPEKITNLRRILDDMHNKITPENLQELRFHIHKIAGSAGTYGFPAVSKFCRDFEFDLLEKIKSLEQNPGDPNWLETFEANFEKIKQDFTSA